VNDVNKLDPKDVPPPAGPIAGESNFATVNHYSNSSIGFLGQILMRMDPSRRQRYSFDAAGFSKWILDNLTEPLLMGYTAVNPEGVWAANRRCRVNA
jgi:hypothetical protein